MSLERDAEGGLREASRDHAARLIQKLDLHKRSTASSQASQGSTPGGGGIASLISASHNILPVGPGAADGPKRNFTMPASIQPTSSLAPSTLANPPAATNLSHTAVVVSGERGLNLGRTDGSGVPSGILANLWGSNNWGHINRLGPDDDTSQPSSPRLRAISISQDDSVVMDGHDASDPNDPLPSGLGSVLGHRKNMSVGGEINLPTPRTVKHDAAASVVGDDFPALYPLPLKAQNAQFHTLFPAVPKSEKVVLVFRATWNPNDQQEFPGRVYVTHREIYFFSNHLGLVLITGVSLSTLDEVTAAPGRDCDFIYLHLREGIRQDDARRITIKIFLEPLRLLQRRLNFLVRNARSDEPESLEEILRILIKMESDPLPRRSSVDSWEDVIYEAEDSGQGNLMTPDRRRVRNLKASLRIDGSLYGEAARTGRELQKFKLPAQAVVYAPSGMQSSVSRDFNVSAKALFHVMFGDKSAVFQLLYANRRATNILQTPWTKTDQGHWNRRFTSQDQSLADTQTIDIFNDHLCYVVTSNTQPWRQPYRNSFALTTKFVLTHTAKSRCKLAIFEKLVWHKHPPMSYLKHLIERQAYNSLDADALDLSNVAMDQVAKLGNHSKTNKAVDIFGSVGQQSQAAQIDSSQVPNGALPVIGAAANKPMGIAQLVWNDLFARTLSACSLLFDLMIAVGKGAVSLCNAHTLLVLVLFISALYNGWHAYRDGLVWYHDRSATRFMARIGVVPDAMMTKGVYLNDIVDELLASQSTVNDTLPVQASSDTGPRRTCRTTFHEQLTTSKSLTRGPSLGVSLQQSRDSLAKYRHDLLVALRVINRIEKDVVSAEFETWVHSEEQKCERVENMLRQLSEKEPNSKGKKAVYMAELGEDFAEYCHSCRIEASSLDTGILLA